MLMNFEDPFVDAVLSSADEDENSDDIPTLEQLEGPVSVATAIPMATATTTAVTTATATTTATSTATIEAPVSDFIQNCVGGVIKDQVAAYLKMPEKRVVSYRICVECIEEWNFHVSLEFSEVKKVEAVMIPSKYSPFALSRQIRSN
jgi:hypothetical protein